MRKFNVRWWVVDPRERYERELAALSGECGISVRFHRGGAAGGLRYYLNGRFLDLNSGAVALLESRPADD
jgi:hypothetical protein